MPDKDQREEGERRGEKRGGGQNHRRTSQVGRERESGKSLVFDLQQERWSDEDEEGLRERNSTSGKRRDAAHDEWGESSPSLATRRSPVGHPTPGSFSPKAKESDFFGTNEKKREGKNTLRASGKSRKRECTPPAATTATTAAAAATIRRLHWVVRTGVYCYTVHLGATLDRIAAEFPLVTHPIAGSGARVDRPPSQTSSGILKESMT